MSYTGTYISGCNSPGAVSTYPATFDATAAAIDGHDHTSTKGKQLITSSFDFGAITGPKINASALGNGLQKDSNGYLKLKVSSDMTLQPSYSLAGAPKYMLLNTKKVTQAKRAAMTSGASVGIGGLAISTGSIAGTYNNTSGTVVFDTDPSLTPVLITSGRPVIVSSLGLPSVSTNCYVSFTTQPSTTTQILVTKIRVIENPGGVEVVTDYPFGTYSIVDLNTFGNSGPYKFPFVMQRMLMLGAGTFMFKLVVDFSGIPAGVSSVDIETCLAAWEHF